VENQIDVERNKTLKTKIYENTIGLLGQENLLCKTKLQMFVTEQSIQYKTQFKKD